MRDSVGKLPRPKTAEEALLEIHRIALDKRGHLMMDEHCEWLKLKLKAVGILAKRGLDAGAKKEVCPDAKIGTTWPTRKIPYVPNAVRGMPFTIHPVTR